MKPKRVFITGGAGFIGRWLVDRCLREDADVWVYDNLCAGRLDNLMPFMSDITFCEADILDKDALEAAMRECKPDVVFHLAAHHFIPFCNEHPQETLRVNVEGTHVVLDTAAALGVRVAVVASTGALYPSLDTLLHEDTDPAPPDLYGLSKLLVEHVAEHVARTTSMRCVVTRLFNTYGPYETNPHLIPHIMESLHRGPHVELGNIHTQRDYIYVEDTARFLYGCSMADVDSFQVVNLGTGREYSAEEIVRTIGSILDVPIAIQVDETRVRAVDKMHQKADTARLKKITGLSPQFTLQQGLSRLLQYEKLGASATLSRDGTSADFSQ